MIFQIILAVVAILAGAVASLAGFGIGSLLTPLLAKISIFSIRRSPIIL